MSLTMMLDYVVSNGEIVKMQGCSHVSAKNPEFN